MCGFGSLLFLILGCLMMLSCRTLVAGWIQGAVLRGVVVTFRHLFFQRRVPFMAHRMFMCILGLVAFLLATLVAFVRIIWLFLHLLRLLM